LRTAQSPYGVRPLGGTRKVMIAYEGGVFLRRLGWYGETAAPRMLHPNYKPVAALPVAAAQHAPRPPFCELPPMQRHGDCLSCHGRGSVPLAGYSTHVGMRAVRGLPALTSNRYNKPVGAEKLAVSYPSTCQGYCEVRRAAEGAGSTPSRNAEFLEDPSFR
jgi:hypothetical protein